MTSFFPQVFLHRVSCVFAYTCALYYMIKSVWVRRAFLALGRDGTPSSWPICFNRNQSLFIDFRLEDKVWWGVAGDGASWEIQRSWLCQREAPGSDFTQILGVEIMCVCVCVCVCARVWVCVCARVRVCLCGERPSRPSFSNSTRPQTSASLPGGGGDDPPPWLNWPSSPPCCVLLSFARLSPASLIFFVSSLGLDPPGVGSAQTLMHSLTLRRDLVTWSGYACLEVTASCQGIFVGAEVLIPCKWGNVALAILLALRHEPARLFPPASVAFFVCFLNIISFSALSAGDGGKEKDHQSGRNPATC